MRSRITATAARRPTTALTVTVPEEGKTLTIVKCRAPSVNAKTFAHWERGLPRGLEGICRRVGSQAAVPHARPCGPAYGVFRTLASGAQPPESADFPRIACLDLRSAHRAVTQCWRRCGSRANPLHPEGTVNHELLLQVHMLHVVGGVAEEHGAKAAEFFD